MRRSAVAWSVLVLSCGAASGPAERPPAPPVAPASAVREVVTGAMGDRWVFAATLDLSRAGVRLGAPEVLVSSPDERVVVTYATPGATCFDPRRRARTGRRYCGQAPLDDGAADPPEAGPLVPDWPAEPSVRPTTRLTQLTVVGLVRGATRTVPLLIAYAPSNALRPARALAAIDLALPAPRGADPTAQRLFAQVQGGAIAGRPDLYHAYLRTAAPLLYGLDVPGPIEPFGQVYAGAPHGPDLMSIFTGAAAVRETLALDAWTGSLSPDEPADVPIDALRGPSIPPLPYADWLRGRAAPRVEPAARLVPADAWVLRFSELSDLLELLELADAWGTDLARTAVVEARDFGLRERYRDALGLEVTALGRLFGDLVIDDVSLVGADPFFKDGTDLTVLLHLGARDVGRERIEAMLADAARRTGAVVHTVPLEGEQVTVRRSADGRLRSHAAFVGHWAIVSTSATALARVLATRAGRHPALADALDFRLLRTIYPTGEAHEDGLLYLSDAFVRRMVGPGLRIANRRRLVCAAQMATVANASLAYQRDRGRVPTLAELSSSGYLPDDELRCPDGGRLTVQGGEATCSVHGSLRQLTPLIEHEPTSLTDTERSEYQAFVREYEQVFAEYFDPVAVRFRLGDELSAELHLMPLVDSSLYHEVRRALGGPAVGLDVEARRLPTTLGSLALSLDAGDVPAHRPPSTLVGALLDGPEFAPGAPFDPARWLGDQVVLSVADGEPLFTFDPGGLGMESFTNQVLLTAVGSAITLPLYVTIGLRDPALARRAMDWLESRWQARGGALAQVERYAIEPYRGVSMRVLSASAGPLHVRLWTAMLGHELVVATRRSLVTALIDRSVDGAEPSAAPWRGHALLALHPGAFLRVRETAEAAWQERLRHACEANRPALAMLSESLGPAALRDPAIARRHLGWSPYCPEGGTYRVDPLEGGVVCSIHGRPGRARQGLALGAGSDTTRALRSLEALRVGFALTRDGLRTELRVRRAP